MNTESYDWESLKPSRHASSKRLRAKMSSALTKSCFKTYCSKTLSPHLFSLPETRDHSNQHDSSPSGYLFSMKQTNTNIVTLQSLPTDLHLYIGKFLETTDISDFQEEEDINCITLAGLLNNPEMLLHYLQRHDLDTNFSYGVALSGNLRFLKLVIKKGCPMDKETFSSATQSKSLNMLKWLHSQGCQWDKETFYWAAAHENSLETLMWLHSAGCPWDEGTCMGAAQSGNLETLQWLHSQGCPWNENTFEYAVCSQNLEMLQWLHSQGCPWNESACVNAARIGNLEMLQWLHEHGCPCDQWICSGAAESGNLEMLHWALDHNCPWDEDTCETAAYFGHVDFLKWAIRHGCPQLSTYPIKVDCGTWSCWTMEISPRNVEYRVYMINKSNNYIFFTPNLRIFLSSHFLLFSHSS